MKRKQSFEKKVRRVLSLGLICILIIGSMPYMPYMTKITQAEIPTKNVGLGKSVSAVKSVDGTAANVNSERPLTMAVDGIKNNTVSNYADIGTDQVQESIYFQVDLGMSYKISQISLWRYWNDSRTYTSTVIAYSEDAQFTNPTIVYNSDSSNVHNMGSGTDETYAESSAGKSWTTAGNGRYVRVYMYGRDEANTTNHIVELEVIGSNPLEAVRDELSNVENKLASTKYYTSDKESLKSIYDTYKSYKESTDVITEAEAEAAITNMQNACASLTEAEKIEQNREHLTTANPSNYYVSSTHATEGNAANLFDGDLSTYWHNNYADTATNTSIQTIAWKITGDDTLAPVGGIKYISRPGTSSNGAFIAGSVYYSTTVGSVALADDTNWTLLAEFSGWGTAANTISYVGANTMVNATRVKIVTSSTSNNFGTGAEVVTYYYGADKSRIKTICNEMKEIKEDIITQDSWNKLQSKIASLEGLLGDKIVLRESEVTTAVEEARTVMNQLEFVSMRNALLETLTASNTTFDTEFTPLIKEYNLVASANESIIHVKAQEENCNIVITYDGQKVEGTTNLEKGIVIYKGTSEVNITVTSPDGSVRETYILHVLANNYVYASDLEWASATIGNGSGPIKDKEFNGGTIRLNKDGTWTEFAKGIGTHASSTITYNIAGKNYKKFTTYVGPDYTAYETFIDTRYGDAYGDINVKIQIDGQDVTDTVITNLKPNMNAIYMDVDIPENASTISLIATSAGENWGDRCAWGDAKFHREMFREAFTTTYVIDGEATSVKTPVGEIPQEPALPTKTEERCVFAGWYTQEYGGVEVTEFNTEQTVYAQWKQIYTVTVHNGVFTDSVETTRELPYNSKINLTTTLAKVDFAGWYVGDKLIGTEPTLIYYANADMNFVAKSTAEVEKTELSQGVRLDDIIMMKSYVHTTKTNVRFYGQVNMIANKTPTEAGVVWTTSEMEKDNLTIENAADKAVVRQSAASKISNLGQYSITITGAPSDVTMYGRLYVKYSDSEVYYYSVNQGNIEAGLPNIVVSAAIVE